MSGKIKIGLGGQAFCGGIMLCRRNYMATAAVTKNGIKTNLRFLEKKSSKIKIAKIPLNIYNSVLSSFFVYYDYYSLRYGKKAAAFIIASFLLVIFAVLLCLILFNSKLEALASLPTPIEYPNIADAVLYVAIVAVICALASVLPFTRKSFKYHAAEHKIINCIESVGYIDEKNIYNYSSFQKRCGTMTVTNMVIMLLFLILFIPNNFGFWITATIIIIFLSATSFFSKKIMNIKGNGKIIAIIRKPGFLFQRVTTKKPDEIMIKCAIAAANEILKTVK